MKRVFFCFFLTAFPLLAVQAQTPPKPKPVVAPTPPVVPPRMSGTLADLMAGKIFPLTQPVNSLDPAFHSLVLVDSQGKAGLYMSKGETFSVGGETFLVAYDLPTTNAAPPRPGAPPPPAPLASLILISLHAVQAMGAFHVGLPAAPADTPPAAPEPPAAPPVETPK